MMLRIRLTGDALWQRMDRAVEKVRERLERATAALRSAGVPYAVAGGNAVRVWVAQVDEAAVRTTRVVDLLIRRTDLPAAAETLERAGFVYRHVAGIDMFLDGPTASARDAVHIVFAAEKVHEQYLLPAPDVTETERVDDMEVLTLAALVRMKLTSFRRRDQMHLIDMIEVGLVDPSSCDRYPPELASRLRDLLDNPEG